MSYINDLLFGVYPYIAGATFLIASWIRYDREQFTWRASSSQMLSSKGFRRASVLFHVGVLFIFFGHLVGLLTPHWVYEPFISSGNKQLLAILSGGAAGIACWVGAFLLLRRRLGDARVRATSTKADIFILVLLFVQVTLGLLTIPFSLGHLDGSVMLKLAAWAQSLATLQSGAAAHIADVSLIYKLHILVGLTMFIVFPFTRMVHIWSVPVKYFGRSYQVVRTR
ncbi:nitrate reductase 1 cytochrome b(NR) subunit gamma [Marinobacterium nitratireducens]|uniref:nitrate reductase (quinone) n=1 Tax=Marinobacterium nitratireducens TaxID=518897 RepID=A0A917Z746_9GAMM|nr:respiratory nitrate reductase subunit gamma [Marinobacterium nitratireducens]GGO76564.1 nitrate reductase 1 cytochrome b(NR) subunit gamma [Marinobacterium nitratireducens]